MSRFLILFCVLADVLAVLAMGSKTKPIMSSLVNAPCSPSPSENGKLISIAEAPVIRKLGKHQKQVIKSSPAQAPSDVVDNEHSSTEANSPNEESTGSPVSEMNKIHLVKHQRNVDKSIAGGAVILGGLATIFLVAVFRYIRATRRKSIEPSA